MKFLAMTLIPYAPDPVTGVQPSTNERLRAVVDNAVMAEELGVDPWGRPLNFEERRSGLK